jgi:hypothetical protein
MPEQNWGYVVLLNSTVSYQALEDMNHLAINFLSKDFPKPQQPVLQLPASELQKFAGFYTPRAPRSQLFAFLEDLTGGTWIRVANGRLHRAGLFSKKDDLFPVGKNLFRGEKDPEASAVFFPDQTGRMIYVRSGGDGEPYGEKINPLWPYGRLAILAASCVLMASTLLYALVWLLLWLFGKLRGVRHLRVRVVPLLAVLCLLAVVFAVGKATSDIGVLNFWSLLVWVGTVLFAVLSLTGLAFAVSVPETEIHKWVRIHSLLVSLACCIVTIFLSEWHVIGLRLW